MTPLIIIQKEIASIGLNERLPKKKRDASSEKMRVCSHVFVVQHNFTDGMALGSAFLIYGSVGGWSRTVFLLAHELPQEVLTLFAKTNLCAWQQIITVYKILADR